MAVTKPRVLSACQFAQAVVDDVFAKNTVLTLNSSEVQVAIAQFTGDVGMTLQITGALSEALVHITFGNYDGAKQSLDKAIALLSK